MAGLFKYLTLYHRLLALSEQEAENPNSCWLWRGAKQGRTANYPKINVWTGGKTRTLAAHRVSLVVSEIDGQWDLFWDLYKLYSIAGFEADHVCNNPSCINPDHLEWKTEAEHLALTLARRREARSRGLGVSP